jgi:hypothetical protein
MTPPSTAFIPKIFRLSWRDRLLIMEAIFYLAVSGLAIAVLPFRQVGRLAAWRSRRSEPARQTRCAEIRRIRWAIVATARRVPWSIRCFQEGLAAQLMLRRRGVSSVLYYGAVPDQSGGLCAHVWVRAGRVDVLGSGTSSRFALLATFPPQADSFGTQDQRHRNDGQSARPQGRRPCVE